MSLPDIDLGHDTLLIQALAHTPEKLEELADVVRSYPSGVEIRERREESQVKRDELLNLIRQLQDPLQDKVLHGEFSLEDKAAAGAVASMVRIYGDVLLEVVCATDWDMVPFVALMWFNDHIIGNGAIYNHRHLLKNIMVDDPTVQPGAIVEMRNTIAGALQIGQHYLELLCFFAYIKAENLMAADPRAYDYIPGAILHAWSS